MNDVNLLREAVVDDDILTSLRHLVVEDEPLTPDDLWKAELAIRALILADDLHTLPQLVPPGTHHAVLRDSPAPLGDHVLDYEFVQTEKIENFPVVSLNEINGLKQIVERAIVGDQRKLRDLPVPEVARLASKIPERFMVRPDNPFSRDSLLQEIHFYYTDVEEKDDPAFHNELIDYTKDDLLEAVTMYAVALVCFERLGASIFSQTPVGQACHQYVFSAYPQQLFAGLDEKWSSFLRRVMGPGIGVSVPPLLACALTRVNRRSELSHAIRDLRNEYQDSRTTLWDYLEEMWHAPELKKQLRMLEKLDKATQALFQATFPERFRFLETAWSASLSIADLKPMSAVGEIGKAMLKRDEYTSAVAGIGFMRQLSTDLQRIGGLDRLLPRVLTRTEKANFGLLR